MKEVWKDIDGYSGDYQISNFGRVKSIKRNIFLKQRTALTPSKKSPKFLDYQYVMLYKSGNQKQYSIHRLVAIHFLPNPENKSQVNHLDGNVYNNKLSNLEWTTPSENVVYSIKKFGRFERRGEANNKSKFTSEQVLEVRNNLYPKIKSQRKVAALFGVSQTAIKNIVNRKTWNHI